MIAHEVVQHTRRLVDRPRSTERILLEMSRVLGHSARIMRPLVFARRYLPETSMAERDAPRDTHTQQPAIAG